MATRTRADIVLRALEQYRKGLSVEEIADQAKVTPGIVCRWARDAGISKRGFGRTTATTPDKASQEILKELHTSAESFAVVAKKHSISRQAAYRIYNRWYSSWTRGWALSVGVPLERPKRASRKPVKKGRTPIPESEKLSVVITFRLSTSCVLRLRRMLNESPFQNEIRSEKALLQKLAIHLAKQETLPLLD